MVEFGVYSEEGKLRPIGKLNRILFKRIFFELASIRRLFTDLVEWKERQDIAREALMEEGRREVATALEVITRDELIWVGEEKGGKSRRAAVFYFDKVEF